MHLEAKTTFVPSRHKWQVPISTSTACWTRDLTGNQEAEALDSMIMNQQHIDQYLLSHHHVRITHSFVGPAPSSPPNTTKVSITYLFLLLTILTYLSWGVGGKWFQRSSWIVLTEKSPPNRSLYDHQPWEKSQTECSHLILRYDHALHSILESQGE